MAEAKAEKAKAAKAPAAEAGTSAKKRAPRKSAPKKGAPKKGRVDTAAELSDDVLEAVESGQRAAIDAVHRFLETVDEALNVQHRQDLQDWAIRSHHAQA